MGKRVILSFLPLLLFGAAVWGQFPPAGTDTYGGNSGQMMIELYGISPIENVTLGGGPVTIQRGAPFDPGDGQEEIPTEMLALNLTGAAPIAGSMTISLQFPTPPSQGRIKANAPGPDYPAESFFDVFFYAEFTDIGLTLTNATPMHISNPGLNSIPWPGQPHAGNQPTELYDPSGTPRGKIHFFGWTPIVCPPGPPFCDSTMAESCLRICPKSDIVYRVVLIDSCGNRVCDMTSTWLDFSQCPAQPCPNEEPNWPKVYPDSCDPVSGTHFFTVDASLLQCTVCQVALFVNGVFCRTIDARFLDNNGDKCVTPVDFATGAICNDFNCDGILGDGSDYALFSPHLGHCCPNLPCPPGTAFCDSTSTDPCLLICPKSDIVYKVMLKDSCGNPICGTSTWLDFSQCPAEPCPNEEPNWPRVYPDSCDPATGTNYFTVDASLLDCTVCQVGLFVNGVFCRTISARFLDINNDKCVTAADFIAGATCSDFNCDGISGDANDYSVFSPHLGHCCPNLPCPPGPAFCDSATVDPCLLVCPKSDIIYHVTLKDSCGNPVCGMTSTWLDFSQCEAQPCPNEESGWPRVFPDSCQAATGIHYFTVDASMLTCTECMAMLYVNGVPCRMVSAHFLDVNGDQCVTAADFTFSICNDYNCDGVFDSFDYDIFKLHLGHCCFACDCYPGDPNGTAVINALDITYLINYLYKHGPAPVPYPLCSGDANCDCVINALDITYLINFLYKHGPAPCDCATWVSHCGAPLRK